MNKHNVELPSYCQRALTHAAILLGAWLDVPRAVLSLLAALGSLMILIVLPLTIIALPLWVWASDRMYINAVLKQRARDRLADAMKRAFGDGK